MAVFPSACSPPSYCETLFNDPVGPWLLLSALPRFGGRRREAAKARFPDLSCLTSAGTATLKAVGLGSEACQAIAAWQRRDHSHPLIARLLSRWEQLRRNDIQLVSWADADYPPPLRHIHDAPLLLYLRGDRSLLGRDQVGIVGSRNASRAGLEHARAFAAALSEAGYLVTSGMALGVDGAAHAGALDRGFATVAVIGSGLDRPYPYPHKALSQRIANQGALVSEYPPGTPPKAGHFPRRNRIISGMSRGILVVEASLRSGSLITARLALEQGREVFAVPGSIHSPLARGCHELIRQGARLVETVEDIREELPGWWQSAPAPPAKPRRVAPIPAAAAARPPAKPAPAAGTDLESREIAVLEALGYDPASTDDLCSATGLAADQLVQSLLLLELQGLVEAVPGGFQKVV